jgi:hypothetical protein
MERLRADAILRAPPPKSRASLRVSAVMVIVSASTTEEVNDRVPPDPPELPWPTCGRNCADELARPSWVSAARR